MGRHAQYINWGELDWGDRCSGTNWASIGKWWAIALCITCFVYSNSFISIVILLLLLLLLLVSSLSILLNSSYLNPRVLPFSFWFSSPIPLSWGGEWVSGCVVLSCWLGLNQDTYLHITEQKYARSDEACLWYQIEQASQFLRSPQRAAEEFHNNWVKYSACKKYIT